MEYTQQANAPSWYGFDKSNFEYYSVCMGSSPFNEWYSFENRKEAVEFFTMSENQRFIDNFYIKGDEIYWERDDKIAEIESIIWEQSNF